MRMAACAAACHALAIGSVAIAQEAVEISTSDLREAVKKTPPIIVEPIIHPSPAKPKGNPGLWVRSTDYPAVALRSNVEGTTAFSLSVDEAGTVTDCVVTSTSGSPELDATTCRFIQLRARFYPATDEDGNAIPGGYSSRVRWQIPVKNGPQPYGYIVTFEVAENGAVENCTTIEKSGEFEANTPGRDLCTTLVKLAPYTDEAGNPVRRKVTLTYRAEVTEPEVSGD